MCWESLPCLLSLLTVVRLSGNLTATADRFCFLGAQAPESAAWIHASSAFEWSRMSNSDFSLATKTRLGVHESGISEPACRCTYKKHRNYASLPHLFLCECNARLRDYRYNMVRDQVYMGCKRQPGHYVAKEPPVEQLWTARRGDVLIESSSDSWRGRSLVDVTIRTPRLHEARIGVRMRATAHNVEQFKFAFYNREFAVRDGELCPWAWNRWAHWAQRGVGFIRRMAQAMAKPGSSAYQVFLRELFTRARSSKKKLLLALA